MTGEFEMLFIKKPKNAWGYIKTVFAVLFRKHHKKEYFEYFKTNYISIKSKVGIPLTIDRRIWRKKKGN